MTDKKTKVIGSTLDKIYEDVAYTAPEEYGLPLRNKIKRRLNRMVDALLGNEDGEPHEEVQMPAPLNAEDLKVEELRDGTLRVVHIPTGIMSHGSGGSLIQRKMAAVRALEGRVQAHYEHEAHLNWVCPRCRSSHSRGHLPGAPGSYRCLRCGYVGGKQDDDKPIEDIGDIKTKKDLHRTESADPRQPVVRPGRAMEDRNPPMMTIPDLVGELKRLNRWGDGGPVFVIDEQLPPGSYLIADLYTDNHVYRIRALTRGSPEKSKLECVAQCRKMRPGEDWTRGNDLSNGRLDWNVWFSILRDIVGYELVSGQPR